MARDTVLPALPGLPALYRRAVTLAAQRSLGRAAAPSVLPAVRHRVDGVRTDLAALTRFQRLIGSAGRDQLPSAYLHTLAFPVAMSVLARPDFPLPLLGMVHLSNEVHQDRQVSAFEPLDVVAYAENLRPHAAGTQLDVVTEISAGDHRVWTGRSVYLARGVRLADTAPEQRREDRPPFAAPTPTGVWTLDGGIGRRYAAVSGDWNPIHLSGPTAKALGRTTPIAHGMYLAARMVDQAVAAPSGGLDWRIDFAAPVPLPGVVTTSFSRTPGDGGGRIDAIGWSAKRRRPHFTGWVRAD
ncbi:MaoC/PaaZ C-terminal domain-containing protein [Arthrobacter burdickii]|uniref:MaoC/PaaZ C-terminal domain-containing protein n=1 Tax=Arthrobacter burdickii TaxID=3035920 RepID=A0ABT8K3T6_9MICC|nr:MaoC/PaaZ C-terminal domain-containing protein [Arthrobacter burdickii]MDN4611653.1 MaoC/PaaZ C-terminal domain-containing protein [Arthrobacter burdickii]